MRCAQAPAERGRFHFLFLSRMVGKFITLMDDDNNILMFVAGAVRRDNEVIELSMEDLFRGYEPTMRGEPIFQPEYKIREIPRSERGRQWKVEFRETPALTYMLGLLMPQATKWGTFSVSPFEGKRQDGGKFLGSNQENFLINQSWKLAYESGQIPESGGALLAPRLHAKAKPAIADCFPSAWRLAAQAMEVFGGMRLTGVEAKEGERSNYVGLRGSTIVSEFFQRENQQRDVVRTQHADRIKELRAGRNRPVEVPAEGVSLAAAIPPEQAASMDEKVVEATIAAVPGPMTAPVSRPAMPSHEDKVDAALSANPEPAEEQTAAEPVVEATIEHATEQEDTSPAPECPAEEEYQEPATVEASLPSIETTEPKTPKRRVTPTAVRYSRTKEGEPAVTAASPEE